MWPLEQKLRFHDLTMICFEATKNTWKTNAQIRFVLDLVMLKTFQFRGQQTSLPWPRSAIPGRGKTTKAHLSWPTSNMLDVWHWTRCEKDWPASSTLCWQLSDDLKEQFSEVWLGTLWCTDTVSLYTNSGPSTWTIMFAIQTCLATWIGRCMINQEVHHTFPCFLSLEWKFQSHQNPVWLFLCRSCHPTSMIECRKGFVATSHHFPTAIVCQKWMVLHLDGPKLVTALRASNGWFDSTEVDLLGYWYRDHGGSRWATGPKRVFLFLCGGERDEGLRDFVFGYVCPFSTA